MRNKILLLLFAVYLSLSCVTAQTTVSQIDQIVNSPMTPIGQIMSERISPESKSWISETMIDSIDQAKIPKIVSLGILLNMNLSNFLIYTPSVTTHKLSSSYMRIGMELGGLIDFLVARHFAIQGRIVFTAEQNLFGVGDRLNHLWSIGVDIPVLFLYRLGNMNKGYFNAGAGIFTHFTFANNLGVYQNIESPYPLAGDADRPVYVSLHDNHAGVLAHFDYEFPIGIQVNANYLVSLTDIFGYYKNTKGTAAATNAFYPQRISLGIAYRWR